MVDFNICGIRLISVASLKVFNMTRFCWFHWDLIQCELLKDRSYDLFTSLEIKAHGKHTNHIYVFIHLINIFEP